MNTATHWGNYDVAIEGGRVVELRPIGGEAEYSPIGPGMPAALYDDCRIVEPMVRAGWLEHGPRKKLNRRGSEPFVAVSWDTALRLAADELARVKSEHGNEAIYGGSYGWSSAGRFHHAQSQVHRFLNLHGGYTYSVNTYSTAALEVILPHVIGLTSQQTFLANPTWAEIAAHGELVVAFGGLAMKNTQVNPGGVGRHEAGAWQRRCREAGVEFVNIGPVRDDAAEFLDAEWLAPRPNTDVALMLGIAHTLVVEELYDEEFLTHACVGFDRLRAYVLGETDGCVKDAAWAAAITELDETTIVSLARRIAARRTLIAASWSVQRADHGEQTYWMAVALAAMSGSMGRPGGGFGAGYGAVHSIGAGYATRMAALPQGVNPVQTFIPVARIADLLLEPGATIDYDGQRLRFPDIRLVYWCGGNPFHHHQDLNRLVRAWQEPETVIVHEPWWNPLARFADVVFPAATMLERNDFAAGYGDPWISAMHKAADPPGQTKTDYEIFSALAERLGFGPQFTEGRSADEWVRHLYDESRAGLEAAGVSAPSFDEFWAAGRVELPLAPAPQKTFEALRRDAEANPVGTPSGKIELFSVTIDGFGYDDCPGHPTWLEPAEWLGSPLAERFPLHLVSNQPRTRLHSQYDNGGYSRAAKVQDREPLLIHPDAAAHRDIRDGDLVRVFNERGACLAGAVVTDRIRPDVVQLPTGAWYDPADPGVAGSLERHGNPNVLTLDKGTSRLAQGPIAHTTLVEVQRVDGTDPPPVMAFEPPRIVRVPASTT